MPRIIPEFVSGNPKDPGPVEKEMAFRQLESMAAAGDQEAAAVLQKRSGQRQIVRTQIETGAPSELPGPVQTMLGPGTPEVLAENRLLSLGGSIAGAPLGPLGSAAGATAGTAAEQLIQRGQINPRELAQEGAINLAMDTLLPGVGRLARASIRKAKGARKLFEEVAQNRIFKALDNVFRDVDPTRAGKNFQALREKGIVVKGTAVRNAFEGKLNPKQLSKTLQELDTVGLYPNENLIDVKTLTNKLANVTKESPTVSSLTGLDDFDFGELQNLRSKFQKLAYANPKLATDKPNKFNRLMKTRDNIDEAIENVLSKPENLADRELYQSALNEYRLSKIHASAGQILEDLTKTTRDGTAVEFSLGRFSDILRNPTPKYRSLVRDIESKPGLKEVMMREVDALSSTQPKLILDGFFVNPKELPQAVGRAAAELPIIGQVHEALGALLSNVAGRNYVKRIIATQEGRLTPGTLTIGLNAVRRTQMPIEEQEQQP